MFTGLIQSLGLVQYLEQGRIQVTPTTAPAAILADIALGDSIAVDGICLTVETILAQGFVATASPETCDRTTLGNLTETSPVNLETSLRVGSKIGGHFVTGHVDGQGRLISATQDDNAWTLTFAVDSPIVTRYIAPKGSISVNGVSLTVATCSAAGDEFTVAVIPVTYQDTNLQHLSPGASVNLEGDILGKYVERFTRGKDVSRDSTSEADLSLDFLAENGYL
ncbi:MAG: riboflavin synthase [Cyanobacteria bacterium J06632_22]